MQSVHKSVETKSRRICSVPQCSSYCTKGISLHAFPSDSKACNKWKSILKIGKPVTKYMLVCSLHFTETDFTITANKRRRLKKIAIPSQKIPKTSDSIIRELFDRSQGHCQRIQEEFANKPEPMMSNKVLHEDEATECPNTT